MSEVEGGDYELAKAVEAGTQQVLIPAIKDMGQTLEKVSTSVGTGADRVADTGIEADATATQGFHAIEQGASESSTLSGQDLQAILDPEEAADAPHQIALGGDSATGDVSTAPGEAIFWSGATVLKPGETVWPGAEIGKTPDGQPLLLAGEDNAKMIARAQGKASLESLIEDRGITMEPWSDDPAVQQSWKDISARYASGVSGDVSVVLGESLREGNIWETVERGRLMSNLAVTSITKIDLKTLEKTLLWRRDG
jgi:hypothetical protein